MKHKNWKLQKRKEDEHEFTFGSSADPCDPFVPQQSRSLLLFLFFFFKFFFTKRNR